MFGGFPAQCSFVDVRAWVEEKCTNQCRHKPNDIYKKGESFKGIVFAKFASQSDRDAVVQQFRTEKFEHADGVKIWSAPDRPLEIRAQTSFLFSLKKELIEWGFARASLWVDEENFVLVWNGDLVTQTQIRGI